jgi:hypothetical protein
MALRTVTSLARVMDKEQVPAISKSIAMDPVALSCASEIVTQSYVKDRDSDSSDIKLPEDTKNEVLQNFSGNVLNAARAGGLLEKSNAGFILWTMARVAPQNCPALFSALRKSDPTLDRFALCYLDGSWDSTNGISYSLPRDTSLHDVYCPLSELKSHAAKRLLDTSLQYPVRAAWRSVVEDKSLYGVDGTEARR